MTIFRYDKFTDCQILFYPKSHNFPGKNKAFKLIRCEKILFLGFEHVWGDSARASSATTIAKSLFHVKLRVQKLTIIREGRLMHFFSAAAKFRTNFK